LVQKDVIIERLSKNINEINEKHINELSFQENNNSLNNTINELNQRLEIKNKEYEELNVTIELIIKKFC
jgi:hypothetical protein